MRRGPSVFVRQSGVPSARQLPHVSLARGALLAVCQPGNAQAQNWLDSGAFELRRATSPEMRDDVARSEPRRDGGGRFDLRRDSAKRPEPRRETVAKLDLHDSLS